MNDLDHLQIIFESTGIYSRGMTRFCRVNQINYIEMNPLEAKFRTSSLRSWKTDQADAHKLALLAFNMKDAKIQRHTEEIYFELRERARFHLEMENDQNKLKVELVEVLHQTFPGLEKLFKNRYSKIALNIAKVFPHPNCVFALTHDELTQRVWDINTKINSSKKILIKIVFELPFYYHASYYICSLSEGTASACSLRLALFPQESRYKYFAYICNHSPLYFKK
ncbi:hypothetical protein HMPREF1208_00632 [Staphylococcus sp. HGB0015]|nr:hypothetical protein HMPREF1208_00632 [Staphylococcus sp. HGB0015]